MSSSVIVALTRMWRTIVAIIRGGNLWGAAWHRPQLARNLCSPSARMASLSSRLWTAGPVEVAFIRGSAIACTTQSNPRTPAKMMILTFISSPFVPMEKRSDKRYPWSKD